MRLLDCFYQEGVVNCYTFVYDERDPWTNYYTMLATDHDGRRFSQWATGFYEPGEANPHVGARQQEIGEALVEHLIARLSEPAEGGRPEITSQRMARGDAHPL